VKRLSVLLIFVAILALGCTRNQAPNPATRLSFQRFVAVVSELASAQPHQRAAILKKHRTSDAEIREFVAAYARHPTGLATAFDSVERRLEKIREAAP
jgi:hypothetical protein